MVRNSLYDSRGCPVSVVCFHFRCCANICASSTFMCVCFLLHSTFSFTLFCFVFVIVIRQLQCLTQLHTSANIYLCVVCRARERERVEQATYDLTHLNRHIFVVRRAVVCVWVCRCRHEDVCSWRRFCSVPSSFDDEQKCIFLFWLGFPFPLNTIDTIYKITKRWVTH